MFPDIRLRRYDQALYDQAVPIIPLRQEDFADWLKSQSLRRRQWIESLDFRPEEKKTCFVPGAEGGLESVLVGTDPMEPLWSMGRLPGELPAGEYRLEAPWDGMQRSLACVAWGLGAYRFERYRTPRREHPILVLDPDLEAEELELQVRSTYWVRDLVNTPAAEMMPEDLAHAMRTLAALHDAEVDEVVGEQLLEQGYPVIHAVGRASSHPPRLLDLHWGSTADPAVVLVGKGVCFDSGGLDLKTASGMRLMKKDMGGAAHVLGLARMIMDRRLPVRLRVLIPAVENAVSGDAYRPGDVLRSRAGKTIEVDNTDAEGRLVLCDALAEAGAGRPVLIVDFATLTGAARVALGTEVAGFFTDAEAVAGALSEAAARVGDPVWRLPLHRPYRSLIDSGIADLVNSAEGPYGGAITAALFLNEFVPDGVDWLHLDVMAWNTRDRPGRPKGGEAMGLRAVFELIRGRFGGQG